MPAVIARLTDAPDCWCDTPHVSRTIAKGPIQPGYGVPGGALRPGRPRTRAGTHTEDASMALTAKDRAEIAALVAETVVATLAATPTSAPATHAAASPLVSARRGKRLGATRAAGLSGKIAGRYCNGHGTHEEHGFAFPKTVCPRDQQPL